MSARIRRGSSPATIQLWNRASGSTTRLRYRVVPALSGSLAPSREFAFIEAAREWAALMARVYPTQFDLWDIDVRTGRGPLLASFHPSPALNPVEDYEQ